MNNIIELTDTAKSSSSERANKYRLDEINKIRDYFNNEIKERKHIIKKLNEYLVSFDYLDKIFNASSASFGTLSIASYALVVGTPAGIAGSSLTLIFTIGTVISKSLLKVTKKRKKKHNKIIALAKNKLNTIDTLLSSTLYDSEISDEEFSNIITEANIYENIKENIKELTIEPSSLERTGSVFKKLKNTTNSNSSILADELHKPITRKFNIRKVYSQFKDNICGANLADMQSLSRKNKGIKYLLCVIDLYSKYAFVIPLKDKKGISIVNAFDKIIKQSNRKPNKIWVDQGGEFYNNVFEKWLSDNDKIMYSTFNESKAVVTERFIRTLKNKLYKHMTATGKNVYYNVSDNVVIKYNNTKHSTIKMKPIDLGDNNKRVYIDEHNEKDSRFKVRDRIRIS